MLIVFVLLAGALGIIAALARTPPPGVVEPVLAWLMIGVGLLNVVAGYREPAYDRRGRLRQMTMGAFFVLSGATQFMPRGSVRLSIQAVLLAAVIALLVLTRRRRWVTAAQE